MRTTGSIVAVMYGAHPAFITHTSHRGHGRRRDSPNPRHDRRHRTATPTAGAAGADPARRRWSSPRAVTVAALVATAAGCADTPAHPTAATPATAVASAVPTLSASAAPSPTPPRQGRPRSTRPVTSRTTRCSCPSPRRTARSWCPCRQGGPAPRTVPRRCSPTSSTACASRWPPGPPRRTSPRPAPRTSPSSRPRYRASRCTTSAATVRPARPAFPQEDVAASSPTTATSSRSPCAPLHERNPVTTHRAATPGTRILLSKVPEVTAYFWIIKVLCTTVGESAADFLNVNVNLGLTGTSVATGVLLVIVLAAQFAASRYIPVRYWAAVTLVSVFGTLVTDELTDSLGVPLELSTVVFAVLLAVVFVAWYRVEGTLSIHSILTRRREAFYWLAILVTFALGTATGDLMAEVLGLGYLVTGAIVAALIAVLAIGWRAGLNPVLAFWFIYVLTRPLGASIGDFLSQPADLGGLALGATLTSIIFLVGIIVIVGYLAISKADVITGAAARTAESPSRGGLAQTVAVVGVVLVAGVAGYFWRTTALQDDTTRSA